MMNYPKLSVNDDLKIDWDDHHLVVFHFFRGDGKSLQPCKKYYSVTKTIIFIHWQENANIFTIL